MGYYKRLMIEEQEREWDAMNASHTMGPELDEYDFAFMFPEPPQAVVDSTEDDDA